MQNSILIFSPTFLARGEWTGNFTSIDLVVKVQIFFPLKNKGAKILRFCSSTFDILKQNGAKPP